MIKINDFYEIEIEKSKNSAFGVTASICNKITGSKTRAYCGTGTIFLMNDDNLDVKELKEASKEKMNELANQGMLLKLTWKDIWVDYIGIDEDVYLEYINGYDKRTRLYLEKVLKNIGLIEEDCGWEEEKFEILKQYSIWGNLTGSGYVDVGRLEDGKYIAQYSYRTDIDDYEIVKLYFDHLPTEKDIRTSRLVNDIEVYFSMYRRSTFVCWECGRDVHWLDTEGNLEVKFMNLKKKYCGC